MITAVDAHVHLWRYRQQELDWINEEMAVLRRDFLVEDLERELSKNSISGAVAVQARSSLEENDFLIAEAARSRVIWGVVGWVDLCALDVRQVLERYAEELVGVRHIVQSEPDDAFLLREDFARGVALLPSFDLCYDVLIVPRQLDAAIRFADRHPRLRLVLDHLAKPPIKAGTLSPWESSFRELARRPQVWLKASGLITEADWERWQPDDLRRYLDVAFEAFGPARVLFGSDFPVCLLAGSYERVRRVLVDYIAALSQGEQARVLGQNAIDFYRLTAR